MKAFLATVLSVSILFSTAPKAEAGVGLLLRDEAVKSMGGIVGVSGLATLGGGIFLSSIFGYNGVLAMAVVVGYSAAITGLIILDEKNADLRFTPMTLETAGGLGVTSAELAVYNSEVEELNLIRSEVESRINRQSTQEEVNQIWMGYKDYLSPETMKVAGLVILKVFEKQ
jgi:hypothetical protein